MWHWDNERLTTQYLHSCHCSSSQCHRWRQLTPLYWPLQSRSSRQPTTSLEANTGPELVQSWSRERETSQVTTVDSVVWTIIAGGWGQYITVVGKWSRNDPGKLLWVLWLWFGNKVITGEMRQELCDKHDRVVMNLKPINHIQTLLWFPVLQIVNFLSALPTSRLI